MKRYIFTILTAVAILSSSCEKESVRVSSRVPEDGIVLKLTFGDEATKADKTLREGEAARNENVIQNNRVDIFFFRDSTDAAPVRKYKLNASVQDTYVSIPTTFGEVKEIFGGQDQGKTCYVFVVANFDGTYPSKLNASQFGEVTLGDLRALDLATAHWSTGNQNYFVMTGGSQLVLRNALGSTPATGTIKIRRIAAKVTFSLTVASSTEDGSTNWVPLTEAMSVYMVYSMRKAKLGAEPTMVPVDESKAVGSQDDLSVDNKYLYEYSPHPMVQTEDIIQHDRNGVIENDHVFVAGKHDDGGQVTDTDTPFYTYPVSWDPGVVTEPYMKLIIPWNNGTRTKQYYYKIPFPVSALERNNWYKIYIDVQILGSEEPVPPVIEVHYCVCDWAGAEDTSELQQGDVTVIPAQIIAARYLSVPTTEYVLYNEDEIRIPITSSHDVEVVGFNVSSDAYKDSHMVDANYVGRTPRIYNPFTSCNGSSTIRAVHPDYSQTTVSAQTTTFTFGNDPSGTYGWSIKADGRDAIIVHHTLNRDLSGVAYDVAPYTIRFRIRHISSQNDYYSDVTVEQRPSIIIKPETNGGGTYGNAFVNGAQNNGYNCTYRTSWTGSVTIQSGPTDGSWTSSLSGALTSSYFTYFLGSAPNGVSNSSNQNLSMYVIETSVLPSTGNIGRYMLGDPRSLEVDNINGTAAAAWSNNTQNLKDWDGNTRGLTYYYPSGRDTTFNKMIAPKIRIPSSHGATVPMYFEDAHRRCASYQEDGYPAGRWRLPTMAEIEYIAQLNSNGKIPLLLGDENGTTDYWCNSGYVTVEQNQTPIYTNNTASGTARYVRCVYDDWYWGVSSHSRLPENRRGTFVWGDQLRSSVVISE